jgi:hypothetical protein
MNFAIVLSALSILCSVAEANGVYTYAPTPAVLQGTLETKVFPGPPNYESVRNGDARERVWLLRLSKAIELRDDGDPKSNNEAETNVRELQLIPPEGTYQKALDGAVGKSVQMSGKLTHALFGHHHTRVLLEVQQWSLLK